tara:strand:+ start:638 stop:823 length:186 start_codon:yes stop_codon:yes gene_type:complete
MENLLAKFAEAKNMVESDAWSDAYELYESAASEVKAYHRKHPFSHMGLTQDELELLKEASS